jgi:hypothetical protein
MMVKVTVTLNFNHWQSRQVPGSRMSIERILVADVLSILSHGACLDISTSQHSSNSSTRLYLKPIISPKDPTPTARLYHEQ